MLAALSLVTVAAVGGARRLWFIGPELAADCTLLLKAAQESDIRTAGLMFGASVREREQPTSVKLMAN